MCCFVESRLADPMDPQKTFPLRYSNLAANKGCSKAGDKYRFCFTCVRRLCVDIKEENILKHRIWLLPKFNMQNLSTFNQSKEGFLLKTIMISLQIEILNANNVLAGTKYYKFSAEQGNVFA
jgi:hypothetical protein